MSCANFILGERGDYMGIFCGHWFDKFIDSLVFQHPQNKGVALQTNLALIYSYNHVSFSRLWWVSEWCIIIWAEIVFSLQEPLTTHSPAWHHTLHLERLVDKDSTISSNFFYWTFCHYNNLRCGDYFHCFELFPSGANTPLKKLEKDNFSWSRMAEFRNPIEFFWS